MNILIATDLDNGGQMHALYRALNKYTVHTARLITFKDTYLEYETDIFDPCLNEVNELAEWADFYILGEMLKPRMYTQPILNKMTLSNSIIRAGGSLARQAPAVYVQGKFAQIMKTGAYHDWTIAGQIGAMGTTVNMYEFGEWPEEKKPKGGEPIRLVFSGTALKGKKEHSGAYMEAWKKLSKMYSADQVEFITISGLSWQESLKIKSKCNICFDQLKIGAYANSAIEGMYYHMPTFCFVSGWCMTIHPDVPVIPYTSVDDIVNATKKMIDEPDTLQKIGEAGHRYVVDMHSAEKAIKRWESLIEFVTQLR